MERTYYLGDEEKTLEQLDVVALELEEEGEDDRAERAADFGEVLAAGGEVRGDELEVSEDQLGAFTDAGWVFIQPTDETERAISRREALPGTKSAGQVYRTEEGRVQVVADRLTVRLVDDLSTDEAEAALDDAGLVVVNELTFAPNLYEVTVTGDTDPLDVSVALHDDPRFIYAEPNFIEHIPGRFTPTDPDYDEQWQWENDGSGGATADADVDAEDAWEHTRGAGTRVAVIDNGTDVSHPDLTAAVTGAGYFQSTSGGSASFVTGTSGFPGGNHGTFCAGMAIARANNGEGGVGAANEASFIPIACLVDQIGSQTTLARAVAYAADPSREVSGADPADGADIISCSLGPNGAPWTMQTVLQNAIDFAVNSGRGGLGTPVFWATDNQPNPVAQDQVCAYANTIAVGRSDNDDDADGSASGPELDFLAPGVEVYSTEAGGGYGTDTGTSFAAPLSAGVGALVLAADPNLEWDEVRQILRDTCEKVGGVTYDSDGHHNDYGFGRINAGDAVCQALRSVQLTTPQLTFNDVPVGRTTVRAAVFEVSGCDDLTLQVVDGPTLTNGDGSFGVPTGATVTVSPSTTTSEARVWIQYSASGTSPGDFADGTVTIRADETGEEWTIPLSATVVERESVAVDLVLDRSGSMQQDSGVASTTGGQLTRMDLLKFAAPILVEMLEEDDAVGVVRFNHDAQESTTDITAAGQAPFGSGRSQAKTAIQDLSPDGQTSIGDGVALAHGRLGGVDAYTNEAMVVFTDGHENAPKYLSDISGMINETVYAVGLGTPSQLRPSALTQLANGTDGYVVLTDELGSDDYFLLAKYFMQVLAGVKNHDIVVDPESRLTPGDRHRIPFQITEADRQCDVAVIGPARNLFRLELETPAGDTVNTSMAASQPEVSYVVGDNVTFYRLGLPVASSSGSAHRGRWHALLTLNEKYYQSHLTHIAEHQAESYAVAERQGVQYNLSVYTDSDLRMKATLSQDSFEPGATLTLRAVLKQYGALPVTDATVRATVRDPAGTTRTLTLDGLAEGVYETTFDADVAGTYRAAVKAQGRSIRGAPFTREQVCTAGVWHGGDRPAPSDADDPRLQAELVCELLDCLSEGAFAETLEQWGADPDAVQDCLRRYCSQVESIGELETGGQTGEQGGPGSIALGIDIGNLTIADLLESTSLSSTLRESSHQRGEKGRNEYSK